MLHRIRAARAAAAFARSVREAAVPGRINLLAPDRSVFRFDCDALDRFAPRLRVIRFSSTRQLPSMLLGEHEGLEQRRTGAAEGSPSDPFRRSQPALVRALRSVAEAGLLHGFLTANVDYHQDEPLRRAAQRLGLPFFVILKETPLSAQHEAWQRARIGEAPVPDRGDHVFVGGPRGTLYVELGSVAPEHLHVTGFPRFDRYRDLDVEGELGVITVLPPNRLHDHRTEVFDAILDASLALRERTAATLVLKCKDNRAAREVRTALEERSVRSDRVFVTAENPAEHLARSALVVGSSTTALAEALLTRGRVLNLVAQNDLLGLPARPDLGYTTYASHEALVRALADIDDLRGVPVPAGLLEDRRSLVADVLTIPEGRTASGHIEELIVEAVDVAPGARTS